MNAKNWKDLDFTTRQRRLLNWEMAQVVTTLQNKQAKKLLAAARRQLVFNRVAVARDLFEKALAYEQGTLK